MAIQLYQENFKKLDNTSQIILRNNSNNWRKLHPHRIHKCLTFWHLLPKHKQGEIRKPSSVISAKNRGKQREWERLEISKKIRDTKGTFHVTMGSIKDRNGRVLTEVEDVKKRWQEYTEELYKKDLPNWDNHDGVITHLEPDILECEVKWALENITMNKASGGDGIAVELFQILKGDAVKVLHSIC